MRAVPMVVAFVVSLLLAPLAAAYKETDHLDSTLSTHQFILDHVPGILEADGHPELAAKLRARWLDDLKWGSIDADRYLCRQANHYMSPDTHAGLATFESAGDLADRQFATAPQDWVQSDAEGALLHLGWAMEPMMDLTEPHHAHLDPIDYHEAYEECVLAHQTVLPAATAAV